MGRYIERVTAAEIISEKCNIPLGDLVDVFAEIPDADYVEVGAGEWLSCEWEVPVKGAGQVLALVCGKYKNITLDHAVMLADYVEGKWILETYPEATDITVSHWAFIPEFPGEFAFGELG